ncbi:MAG: hypothetical protein LBR64_09965 [Dysgonamonadaceae bacterium]|jgi:hypothetical protein|nr:hypothetical protein [Dysgonamonadaceae bacterium]
METNFSEKESLALINEMIAQARNNVRKGAGNSMIFWGVAIAVIALSNSLLLAFLKPEFENYSYSVWALCLPLVVIDFYVNWKNRHTQLVKTHIDTIIGAVWQGFLITYAIFLAFIFALYRADGWSGILFIFITPFVLLLCGLCTYATAKACRFKPFVFGAIVFWAGFACWSLMAVFNIGENEIIPFIILAVCMLLGFVVPGLLLNKKSDCDV